MSKKEIISNIILISGCEMEIQEFEILRNEMADIMINTLGFECISKIHLMMGSGKFWKLQYVRK
jgi:hypothetical protein